MAKFGIKGLVSAVDLVRMQSAAVWKVQELTTRLKALPPSLHKVYIIDEISNYVTTIADVSAAIIQLHPSSELRTGAQQSLEAVSSLMLELNANPLFYWSLAEISLSPVFPLFSQEQQRFVQNLLHDFEREGSHLPREKQNRKKDIQGSIGALEDRFLFNVKHSQTLMKFRYEELDSVPTHVRPERTKAIYDPEVESVLTLQEITDLLGNAKKESVRKRSFLALLSACPKNEVILKELVEKRMELAHLLGYNDYTSFFMAHQMFPNPSEDAISVLEQCFPFILKKLSNELAILSDLKAREEQEDRSNPTVLQPWDVLFYSKRFLGAIRNHSVPRAAKQHSTTKYFTLGNIVHGLQLLLSQSFGLKMKLTLAPNEETWSNDILKMELLQIDTLSPLGDLYFDLFKRPFKQVLSASKLNIRCSKQKSVTSSRQQRPIAVLVCNYEKPIISTLIPDLGEILAAELEYEEVKELFHEFGHAVHAVASQTEFQCFSGTRVPLDFAEFPSNLFELFLTDYEYVQQWALNKETGQVLPKPLFQALVSAKSTFRAIEHVSLLLRSIFDLRLHSSPGVSPGDVNTALMKAFPNMLYCVPGLTLPWYSSFEHLAEYGGSYYTYVMGQVLAELVWKRLFQHSALNPTSGKRLMRLVLQKGGEPEGSAMMGELLQGEQLTGEKELLYAFKCDVWTEVKIWYQNFATDSELVSLETLRGTDTWKELGSKLPINSR